MNEEHDFDSAIEEIRTQERPGRANLVGLSDLDHGQVARLRSVWADLSTERRRWLVDSLAELAEDNFELDYAAVFKVALSDEDADTRRMAIEGLWESDDLSVAYALLAMLANDPAEEVRAAAAGALGHFTYQAEMEEIPADLAEEVRAALLDVIHGDGPLEVRRRAVEAIGFLSEDEEAKQAIAEAYAHPDPRMRTSAVFAMGRSCDPRWLGDLLHEMESEDPQMRFEAARACGELEDPRAVPRLLRLLFDPDLEVRLTAVQSLGAIGGEQAISALRTLTESENEAVAEAAEEALAEAQFAESPFSFGAGDLPSKKSDE
ncbi:MAG: HEAT repeat domain-containing protein [Dehalococcoidales bacterium]|nr:HEAT repeat domain-containing protein [Dehalococcoidales bacterium]